MTIEAFKRHVLTGLAGILERQEVFVLGRARGPEEISETTLRSMGYRKGRTVFRKDVLDYGWAKIPFRDELTELTYQMISDRVDSHIDILEPELLEDDARGFKATVYAFCYNPEFAYITDDLPPQAVLFAEMSFPVPFGTNPHVKLGEEQIRTTIDKMMQAGYFETDSRHGRNYLFLSPKVDQILTA